MFFNARLVFLFVAVFFAASCMTSIPCLDRKRGASTRRNKHFVTITVCSAPVEGRLLRRKDQAMPWPGGWFENGKIIRIDANGGMTVSALDLWPERCLTVDEEELARVSRYWQPFLDRTSQRSRRFIQIMKDPYLGDDNWEADRPLLSLSFGAPGEHVEIFWDGLLSLPPDLDLAVMGTLEMVCSATGKGKKNPLRGLDDQVTRWLQCIPN